MKKIVIGLSILVFLIIGIYLSTPYFVCGKIIYDFSQKNYEEINDKVDWDLVKDDLVEQFKLVINQKMESSGLNQLMAKLMEGVAVKTAKTWMMNLNSVEGLTPLLIESKESNPNTPQKTDYEFNKIETEYLDLDHFQFSVFLLDYKIIFEMKREFLDWKIIKVILPWESLEEAIF